MIATQIWQYIYIYIYIYIYTYIHRHVSRPSQDSSVWFGLTSREQLMSPECSKHQILSFAKMLVVWWTNIIYILYFKQCEQIRIKLRICPYLLKRFLKESLFFLKWFYFNYQQKQAWYHCILSFLRSIQEEAASLRPTNLSKKRLRYGCFPVTLAKFLSAYFLQNTSRWLLLIFKSVIYV